MRSSTVFESIRIGRFLNILLTEMQRRKKTKEEYLRETDWSGKHFEYPKFRKITLIWEQNLTEVCQFYNRLIIHFYGPRHPFLYLFLQSYSLRIGFDGIFERKRFFRNP